MSDDKLHEIAEDSLPDVDGSPQGASFGVDGELRDEIGAEIAEAVRQELAAKDAEIGRLTDRLHAVNADLYKIKEAVDTDPATEMDDLIDLVRNLRSACDLYKQRFIEVREERDEALARIEKAKATIDQIATPLIEMTEPR